MISPTIIQPPRTASSRRVRIDTHRAYVIFYSLRHVQPQHGEIKIVFRHT